MTTANDPHMPPDTGAAPSSLPQALFEHATDLVSINDEQGVVRFISPSVTRMLGYAPTEVIGKPSFDFVHPDDAAHIAASFAKNRESSGRGKPVVFRFRHSDGSWRTLEATSTNLLDNPLVRGVVVNARDITERVVAEQALRESEERFRSLFEAAPLGIVAISPDGTIVLVNQALATMFGYSRADLVGRPLEVLMPEELHALHIQHRAAYASAPYPRPMMPDRTIWGRRRDGQPFPVEIHLSTLQQSGVDLLVAFVVDSSERHAIASALRESEERARLLIDMSPDMVLIIRDDRVTFINQTGLKQMGGHTPSDIIGRRITDLIVPSHHAVAGRRIPQILEGHILPPVMYEVIGLDSVRRQVEVMSTMITDAGVPSILAVARDVTARTAAEERLRLLESVVVHASDSVLVTSATPLDRPGPPIVYVNPAFTRLTGYTLADVAGQSPRILQGPRTDGQALTSIRTALERGEPVQAEVINYARDGRAFWIDLSIAPVRDEDDRITHFIAIQREITARKQAEQLEFDRAQILESMARDVPLLLVLNQVTELVEHQRPELRAAILLLHNGHIADIAAPSLSAAQLLLLDNFAGIAGARWTVPLDPGEIVESRRIAADPRWNIYRELGQHDALQLCWAMPIVSGSLALMGVILIYRATPIALQPGDGDLLGLACRFATLAIERRRLHDMLAYQARYDALTSLPNRYQLHDRLQQALTQAQQHGTCVALLCIDLDRFKHINDTLGHPVGDSLLTSVAQRFGRCLRPNDTLARMGGDEFVVVVPDVTERRDAERIAQRLLDVLRLPLVVEGRELVVTASIGISYYPHDGADATTLLKHADSALYQAKSVGRNTTASFAPELGSRVLAQLDLEQDLHRARERGDLMIYYQPQVDVASGQVVGMEALLRWRHPQQGMVSPAIFIPLAEESGLIVPIGAWVLDTVCRQLDAWRQEELPIVAMAVNVSARQFMHETFVAEVARTVARYQIPPGMLELELTESVVMHDLKRVAQRLQELRALGVRIAIDDFGTGYSSLAYLQQLPIDRLKIDRSFVRALPVETLAPQSSMSLVRAIVLLAHTLDLSVVAEGVELPEQLALLHASGCDAAQGFLFSPAVPAEQVWLVIQSIYAAEADISATDRA